MGGDLRRDAEAIFDASIEAVLPRKLVERSLKRSGNELTVLGSGVTVKLKKNVYIYAFGKAVLGMVTAVDGLCHDHIVHGVASVPEGMVQTLRNKLPHLVPPDTCLVEIIQGAENNMPDASAHRAARRIMEGAQRTAQDDIVIILVSGGGSALLPLPADGLTLQDVRDTTMACARQGASINELNTIRKHLSAVQGGQLAAAVYPASAITLVLSDVVGDPLDVIASGPTVPDPTSFHDCKCILKRLGLTAATLPARVVQHIAAGVAGRVPDTPTGEHVAFQTRPPRVHTTQLVGTNAIALHAARCEAEARGYTVIPWGSAVEMEARAFAKLFAAKLHTVVPCAVSCTALRKVHSADALCVATLRMLMCVNRCTRLSLLGEVAGMGRIGVCANVCSDFCCSCVVHRSSIGSACWGAERPRALSAAPGVGGETRRSHCRRHYACLRLPVTRCSFSVVERTGKTAPPMLRAASDTAGSRICAHRTVSAQPSTSRWQYRRCVQLSHYRFYLVCCNRLTAPDTRCFHLLCHKRRITTRMRCWTKWVCTCGPA
eukprot:m.42409 g.42409  ORF g.42409 m.42409 type:complete len:546 (+) comp15027_c0_seq4:205-1842(+)